MEEPNQDDSGKIKVKKGKRMLTGEEALAVVRSRRVDSDFGRGERQMQMIQAIMNRSKSVSYTHLTLPTIRHRCRSRWSPYH